MARNKPDITLEQAIKKTKDAGIELNFSKGTTLAVDFFELKQNIAKANNDIKHIHWVFSTIIVGVVVATALMLADYAQFAIKAYEQFTTKLAERSNNCQNTESIKTDIQLTEEEIINLKTKLNSPAPQLPIETISH